MVTDSPNPATRRAMPLRYRFHVAMAGVLGVGGNPSEWTAGELETAAELIAQYKRVRRTVQQGAQYRLAGTPGQERSAVQYVSGDQVVVLAHNPLGNAKRGPRTLRLAGLDPDAGYELESDGSRRHGATLLGAGIRPAAWAPIGAGHRSERAVLKKV
nr:GH36 C-terminal domain-containing protein [Nonomuraea sp. FMUSA5-5]